MTLAWTWNKWTSKTHQSFKKTSWDRDGTGILCLLDHASLWQLKNKRPTWCNLLFYFTSYVLNMFQTLIYPSSGACDYSVELPHWSYCSWFDVCWSFVSFNLQHGYHPNPTTLKLQHTSNQEQYDQCGTSTE